MHRIDGPGATVDHRFTDGDPIGGVQATMVTDDWANAIQEEISAVVESTGVALNKSANNQLLVAIAKKISDAVSATPDPWAMQPVGALIELLDNAPVAPPSTSSSAYKYIKLTASDAFNAGILTSESVSGTAPLVNATGVVSLAGSPFNGLTLRLINTERRVIRAGLPGVVEQDALQNITGAFGGGENSGSTAGAFANGIAFGTVAAGPNTRNVMTFDASRVARTDVETRAKSMGATFYLRVK